MIKFNKFKDRFKIYHFRMKFIIASDSLTSDYYSILYEIFNARPFNYVSKWGRIGGGGTGMKILIHGSIVSILRDFILSRYSDRSWTKSGEFIATGAIEQIWISPLIKTGLTYFLRSSKVELQIRLLYPPPPFSRYLLPFFSFSPLFKGKVHLPSNSISHLVYNQW